MMVYVYLYVSVIRITVVSGEEVVICDDVCLSLCFSHHDLYRLWGGGGDTSWCMFISMFQ